VVCSDKGSTEPAIINFYVNGNDLGKGSFVCMEIMSEVERVEFISARTQNIILPRKMLMWYGPKYLTPIGGKHICICYIIFSISHLVFLEHKNNKNMYNRINNIITLLNTSRQSSTHPSCRSSHGRDKTCNDCLSLLTRFFFFLLYQRLLTGKQL
jgi:hypothetical protein